MTRRWMDARDLRGVFALAVVASFSSGCKKHEVLTDAGQSPKSSSARAGSTSPKATPASVTRFVTLGVRGAINVRAITTDAVCPPLLAASTAIPMTVRVPAAAPAHPLMVCEATLPIGTQAATLAGEALPLPVPRPSRIAILGDTGCRMKGKHFQDCRDSKAWPFARIARAIAAWKPELVVHVGDYHYRETACPAGNAVCAGNSFADTWRAWNDDFFTPAAPLLAAAPWVTVRGNHEICKRLGNGWFRYLDPWPFPKAGCVDHTDPYAVPLGGRTLIVFDSTLAHDWKDKPKQVDAYRAELKLLGSLSDRPAFVASHKPVWSVVPRRGAPKVVQPQVQRQLSAAITGALPENVELWIAGHLHLFQAIGFGGTRPASLVSGNGGTELIPPVPGPVVGQVVAGAPVTSGLSFAEHGFTTLSRAGETWTIEARAVDGELRATCRLRRRELSCDPVPAGSPAK